MKEFFGAAPRVIGVISFAALVMTVIHEWGYFSVLGWHLQTIATPYDYLTNSLVWLPSIAGILTGAQVLEASMIVEGDKVRLNKILLTAISVPSLVGVLFYLFVGGEVSPALAVLSLIGIGAVFGLTKVVPAKWIGMHWQNRVLITVPLIVLSMLGYGVSAGYTDLKKTTDVYAIDSKEKQVTRQLVLLRSFEKGILVRDVPAQRIEFIRWDGVAAISRLLMAETSVGYLCLWFGVVCRGNAPSPIVP